VTAEHSGELEGGNYISFVQRGDDWFLCNDEKTENWSLGDVLDTRLYLLFYERANLE
jgi:ubiquitin C-terminal hydrolase